MFGLGMGEIVLLVIIAVVLFGTNDLPKTLRKVAKGVGEFKKVASDAQRSWTEVRDDVTRTIMTADLEDTVRRAVADPVSPSVASLKPLESEAVAPSLVDTLAPESTAEVESLQKPASELVVSELPAAVESAPAHTPVAKPAEHAVVRSPEGPAVDHHHDHHEERGTEPEAPAALPGGERKSV
ncbi:MAG: twin-arginine translocase TatA/TatE family subunit [Silvanigrellales bacterium]|jgi:TatA/E family protein of Tat protein translocase|nr:twin-arginine translocase TatA/TatE family subunit [Silvanigrellales bacterium]